MFDLVTLLLAVSNVLDQPYRETVEVLERFRRDGAIFFVVRMTWAYLPSFTDSPYA